MSHMLRHIHQYATQTISAQVLEFASTHFCDTTRNYASQERNHFLTPAFGPTSVAKLQNKAAPFLVLPKFVHTITSQRGRGAFYFPTHRDGAFVGFWGGVGRGMFSGLDSATRGCQRNVAERNPVASCSSCLTRLLTCKGVGNSR